MINMSAITTKILSPLLNSLLGLCISVLCFVFAVIFLFFFGFYIHCKRSGISFLHLNSNLLANKTFPFLPYDLMRWLLWDLVTMKERDSKNHFKPYGFTIFCGRQGSGKTISMVHYLNVMHKRYPKCKIVTNFKYKYADYCMKDWKDFLEIRNGEDGVIFAIDEIHSEYSAATWKDFPESILSEISQQRKQRVKIVATSQVFGRIAKPIREQAFSVVMCNTTLFRLTFNKEYDAAEYSTVDSPFQVKKKCRVIWKDVFVQSNHLRGHYDTYEKIERMRKVDFIPRNERH